MDDDIQAVIIHNGSSQIQAGFGGDDAPRVVFPTVVGRFRGFRRSSPLLLSENKDSYVGDEAQSKRGILVLKNPVENGVVTNWDDMEKLWNHTFYKELRISPEEHPVLLTESPINLKENKEKMTQIMFETFNTASVYVSVSSILSLYSAGYSTGIVLDSGTNITHAVPIDDNIIPNTITTSKFGGSNVTDFLQNLLLQNMGISFTTTAEREVVNDIKEKSGIVSTDYENQMLSTNELSSVYELPDGRQLAIGKDRYTITESLFQPSLILSESKGVHEIIYSSIMKCEPEKRGQLFNSIVISGGNTMFNGFSDRLTKELVSLAPSNLKIKVIAKDERKYASWIGGSILSSLGSFQHKWITKQEYDENGSQYRGISRRIF